MKKFFNNKFYIILFILSVVFFILYLFLYLPVPDYISSEKTGDYPLHIILNQPDESVNYFFIKQFVFENNIGSFEELSGIGLTQVHPRSTTIVHSRIVPIGFPGFIVIIGVIVKLFVIIFGFGAFNIVAISIVPLVGILSVWCLYIIFRYIFNKEIALLCASFVFVLPPWWYYSSRSFQHNTLFVFLLLLGLVAWVKFLQTDKKYLYALFIGLFTSLALYIRPSEWLWVLALQIFLLVYTRKKWQWKYIAVGSISFVAVVVLFVFTQTWIYGSALSSGYVGSLPSGESGSVLSGPQGIPFFKALVLPFGFSLKNILINSYYYLARIFPLWFILTFFGFVINAYEWTRGKKDVLYEKIKKYTIVYILISLYIIIYYGSWSFFDNLAGRASIGSSHARYFLPIYLGALPYIAVLFIYLKQNFRKLGIVICIFLSIFLLQQSVQIVFLSFEGLNDIRNTLTSNYIRQQEILAITEDNAVVVTRYADKYIFPHRKIISGLFYEDRFLSVKNLLETDIPVYWYDLTLTQDESMQIEDDLADYDMILSDTIQTWENIEMRRIQIKK